MLLDLDDTLLDSGDPNACWRTASAMFAERCGVESSVLFEAITAERLLFWQDAERARVGRHDLRAAGAMFVEKALRATGAASLELARAITDASWDLREEGFCLFPGAVDFLQALRDSNVRLALLTNGAALAQRAKIERFGLDPLFEAIYVEGELGYGKPDERVYRNALAALRTDPAEAWMVGDNLEWDVAAPQRLGIHGIWVDRAGQGIPAHEPITPDRIIHDLAELLHG
jgi:putative hydrolase of the HAD superfamily